MKIINYLKEKMYEIMQLGKTTWILFAVALILNLIIWLIWLLKARYNIIASLFASAILGLNFILAIFLIKKPQLFLYLLAGSAIFVQILFLVLLNYTVINSY